MTTTITTTSGATVDGVRIVDMPDLGAFNASSSVVGERSGSGRFNAASLRQYVGSSSIVNVLDFGAKGDGTTDDTAAIQSVINTYAGKAIVFFPATTAVYITSFKITLPSNTHLIIAQGATIRIAAGANCDCFTLPYIAGTPTTNVLIELYGTLDGNYPANSTHGGGIVTDGAGPGIPNLCSNIYVQGNRQGLIHNFRNWGINLCNCTNGEVSGITVDNCHSSTEFAANNGGMSYNVGFSDCVVSNIVDLGLVLYNGVQKGFIRNCEVFGCTSGGAFIFTDGNGVSNSDCEITGCELHDNGNYGCYVGGNVVTVNQKNSIISGNHIYANARSGAQFNQCDGVLFEGNYVHDNINGNSTWPTSGVYGDVAIGTSATRVSIIGNTITNPQVGRTDGKGYGIGLDSPDYLLISNNRIGDYQTTKSMTAAIGGVWGVYGLSTGNYYGPRIAADGYFPPDKSVYALASVQGQSYDLVTGWVSSTTPPNKIAGGLPGRGLTVGWNNATPGGLGEVDFYVARGAGGIGGFNFFQVNPITVTTGTYTSGTGAVSVTTSVAHGLGVGSVFALGAVTGTGADILLLQTAQTATAGTTGSTINFSIATGKDITAVTGGQLFINGGEVAGTVSTTVGVAGSLLANDGYGNTRLGGALVHGALQSYSLVNAGTVTIQPNTSFVLIQNSASIATGTVVLPDPGGGFAFPVPIIGGNNELEINFQNPVGALTVKAGGTLTVSGAPTTITAASTSINFLQHGSTWLRRIMA